MSLKVIENKKLIYENKLLKSLDILEINAAETISEYFNKYKIDVDYIAIKHKFKHNIEDIDNIIAILLLLRYTTLEILKNANIESLLSKVIKTSYNFNISNKSINDGYYTCRHYKLIDKENNKVIARFRIKDSYLRSIMYDLINECVQCEIEKSYFKSFIAF